MFGLIVIGVAAAIYTASVNRDLAALHRRLDQHQRLIATITALIADRNTEAGRNADPEGGPAAGTTRRGAMTELRGCLWEVVKFLLLALSPVFTLVVLGIAVIIVVGLFEEQCDHGPFGPHPGQPGYTCP